MVLEITCGFREYVWFYSTHVVLEITCGLRDQVWFLEITCGS